MGQSYIDFCPILLYYRYMRLLTALTEKVENRCVSTQPRKQMRFHTAADQAAKLANMNE